MRNFYIIFLSLFSLNLVAQNTVNSKNDLTYLFIEALKNKTFGNISQSAYYFNKLAATDSSCAACYFELSKLYYNSDNKEEAFLLAKKAFILDKSNYWYNKNVADLARLNSDLKSAYEYYKLLLLKPESSLEDKYNYASVLLSIDKSKEAFVILNKIEDENGVSEKISFLKYRYYYNTKKYIQAQNELLKISNLFPNNINVLGMLAELFALQGKDDIAMQWYKKLFSVQPYNANGLLSYARFCSSRHSYDNAKISYNTLFFSDSISIDDKIRSLHDILNEDKNAYSNKVYLNDNINDIVKKYISNIEINELACDYFEKVRNYSEALVVTRNLLSLNSTNGVFYDRLFFYLNILGKYNEVIASQDSVLKKFPNHSFIYLTAGIAFFQLNKIDKSIVLFEEGLKFVGDNEFLKEQFVTFLAEANFKKGDLVAAFNFYDKAVNVPDPNIITLNNYAYYLAENNRLLAKALSMSQITIDKDPKNATFLDTYAWVQYKLKNYDKALKFIKLAIKYSNEPDNDVFEHYGDILFCLNMLDDAHKNWLQAQSLGSSSEKISQKFASFKCE